MDSHTPKTTYVRALKTNDANKDQVLTEGMKPALDRTIDHNVNKMFQRHASTMPTSANAFSNIVKRLQKRRAYKAIQGDPRAYQQKKEFHIRPGPTFSNTPSLKPKFDRQALNDQAIIDGHYRAKLASKRQEVSDRHDYQEQMGYAKPEHRASAVQFETRKLDTLRQKLSTQAGNAPQREYDKMHGENPFMSLSSNPAMAEMVSNSEGMFYDPRRVPSNAKIHTFEIDLDPKNVIKRDDLQAGTHTAYATPQPSDLRTVDIARTSDYEVLHFGPIQPQQIRKHSAKDPNTVPTMLLKGRPKP